MKILLPIILLIFATTAHASNDFQCTVSEAYELQESGKLSSGNDLTKIKIGKEFIVNRQTGQITGGGFVNTMSGQMPIVYDYLPQENGYKAITIYKPNHTVDYLQINEYVSGDKKPFLYKDAWGTMVVGLCSYL